jgi:hypothetical protein
MLLQKWPGSAGIPACNSETHLKAEASFSTPKGNPLTEVLEGFLCFAICATRFQQAGSMFYLRDSGLLLLSIWQKKFDINQSTLPVSISISLLTVD